MENKPKWYKYFFLMGEKERNLVSDWHQKQKADTFAQKDFLEVVKKALETINYDYRIVTIEPSIRKDGNLFFKRGRIIYTDLSARDWEKMAKRFSPQYGSDIANVYELFLWYAYRIAKGYWTIYYVCDDSSSDGNYYDSPSSKKKVQYSGMRRVGGFCDGIGNSAKIVKFCDGYVRCSGGCESLGEYFPVAERSRKKDEKYVSMSGVAWVVLRGENI